MAVERKKKKRVKKRYFLKFFIFIAIVVGIGFCLNTSFFDIQKIKVEDNSFYTPEQVIEMSGVKIGDNLFFDARNSKVKNKMLSDSYIKNVKVSRKLPGTLIIKVEERKEAAAIPYADTYILIDEDGLVLRRTEAEPMVTVLEGFTVKKMDAGKSLDVEQNATLSEALKIIRSMGKSEAYFKKIDTTNIMMKAYIYDQLVCVGTVDVIVENLENGNLDQVLYSLYNQGIQRGTITLGSNGYRAYSALIE